MFVNEGTNPFTAAAVDDGNGDLDAKPAAAKNGKAAAEEIAPFSLPEG